MLRRSPRPDRLDANYGKENRVSPVEGFTTKEAIVRRPMSKDIDRLLAIERQCFKNHRFTREYFNYHLRNPSSIFAVSESSGYVSGYIAGIVYHGSKHRIAKIYSVAVLPGFRKRGIGSLLLKYFEHEAKKSGCSSVTLEVRQSNQTARALYRRFGYEAEDVLPSYYAPRSNGVRMRKFLLPRKNKIGLIWNLGIALA